MKGHLITEDDVTQLFVLYYVRQNCAGLKISDQRFLMRKNNMWFYFNFQLSSKLQFIYITIFAGMRVPFSKMMIKNIFSYFLKFCPFLYS